MNRCEQIQALLLDYLYEVLDSAPAHDVETHLMGCAACQQALVRARGQQHLLASAAKISSPAVRFGVPSTSTVSIPLPVSRAWSRPSLVRWAAAAVVLLAAGGVSFWSAETYQRQLAALDRYEDHWQHMRQLQEEWTDQYSMKRRFLREHSAQAKEQLNRLPEQRQASLQKVEADILSRPLHLRVAGPVKLEPGAVNTYQIQVSDRQDHLLPARINARVVDPSGHVYYQVSDAATDGTDRVVLPRDLPLGLNSKLSLVLRASDTQGKMGQVQERIDLNAPLYVTYLTTDKRLYRPGEIVRFSSLTLERTRLTPPAQPLHLVYSLAAPSQDAGEIAQGRAEVIGSDGKVARWPTDQIVQGVGGGEYKLDSAAREGVYTLLVHDADGRFPPQKRTFLVRRTGLPALDKRTSAPSSGIPKQLNVEFFPEGGDLLAGVLNRVYFRASVRADKLAAVRGHIVDDRGHTVVAEVSTLHDANHPEVNQGMGQFALKPEPGRMYALKIDTPGETGGRHLLPAIKTSGVVLSADDIVTRDGEPIRVAIESVGRTRQVLIGAYCRGHLMAHAILTARQEVKTEVVLHPHDEVGGVYRITIFEIQATDESHPHLRPIAERLVFRRPVHHLKLRVLPEQSSYAPGDHVKISVRAEQENGAPVPALLMVSVVDKNALKLAQDRSFRTMPAQFLLASEVRRPEDLEHADFLVADSPLAERAVDLLLGTQGWRRFAEQEPNNFRRAYPHDGDQLLVSSGQLTPTDTPKTFRFDRERILAIHAKFNQQMESAEHTLAADRQRMAKLDHQYAELKAAITRQSGKAHESYLAALADVNRSRDLGNGLLNAVVGTLAIALLAGGVAGLWSGLRHWQNSLPKLYLYGGAAALLALCAVTSTLWMQWRKKPLLAHLEDRMGREIRLAIAAEQSQIGSQAEPAGDQQHNGGTSPNPGRAVQPMIQNPRAVPQPPAVGEVNAGGRDRGAATPAFVPAHGNHRNAPGQPLNNDFLELATLMRRPPAPPPPMVIRQYAHLRYTGKRGGFFPPDDTETVYWNPVLVLQHGQGEFEFDLNDSSTTFQIRIEGITRDGRVGAITTEFESRQRVGAITP